MTVAALLGSLMIAMSGGCITQVVHGGGIDGGLVGIIRIGLEC